METIKGVNVKSLFFAGFMAGYVMFFLDYWLAGFLGLFGVFPGTKDVWWMILHHVDSIFLFSLAFAWPTLYRRWPGSGLVKGLVYGLVLWIVVVVVMLVGGALGAKMFSGPAPGFSFMASQFILHLVYGAVLGALYVPPEG